MIVFFGTIVLASPPILSTLRPTNDEHVMDVRSPPLIAKKWTHKTIKYLVKLIKERTESYDIVVFKSHHKKWIREHVIKHHPSVVRQT